MWLHEPNFYGIRNSDFYGVRTSTFTPYEPFFIGGGGGLQYFELSSCGRGPATVTAILN